MSGIAVVSSSDGECGLSHNNDVVVHSLMVKEAGCYVLAQKPSFVVLNAIPPRSGIGREAAAGLTAQGADVAPVMLSQRAAFTHGVIDGRTAQEYEPDGKAAEEIASLYAWLCGIVGAPTCGHVRKAA